MGVAQITRKRDPTLPVRHCFIIMFSISSIWRRGSPRKQPRHPISAPAAPRSRPNRVVTPAAFSPDFRDRAARGTMGSATGLTFATSPRGNGNSNSRSIRRSRSFASRRKWRRRTPGGSDGICERPLFHRLKCHSETMAANTAGTLRQYDDNNSRHDPNTIRRVVRQAAARGVGCRCKDSNPPA